jgi:hypothetical protein
MNTPIQYDGTDTPTIRAEPEASDDEIALPDQTEVGKGG